MAPSLELSVPLIWPNSLRQYWDWERQIHTSYPCLLGESLLNFKFSICNLISCMNDGIALNLRTHRGRQPYCSLSFPLSQRDEKDRQCQIHQSNLFWVQLLENCGFWLNTDSGNVISAYLIYLVISLWAIMDLCCDYWQNSWKLIRLFGFSHVAWLDSVSAIGLSQVSHFSLWTQVSSKPSWLSIILLPFRLSWREIFLPEAT